MGRLDVSLCIPAYKAHDAPNLQTIGAALPAALDGLDGELVVALNGIDAAGARVPDGAQTVDLGVNRGVSPGWNAAAEASSGDVLVFGNDDVELGPGSLRRLAEVLREHDDAGVVGPVGTDWDFATGEHRAWVQPEGTVTPCDVVSGFLFACRRETWERVGRFDEFYAPASWEEVDFCAATLAAGLRNLVVADVDVAHEWGISAKQRPWKRIAHNGRKELLWSIHRRNRRHFLRKWAPSS